MSLERAQPLLNYRVLIQYLSYGVDQEETYPNQYTFDQCYPTYKRAKKEAIKRLRGLEQLKNVLITTSKIVPVLLEENLTIQNNDKEKKLK